MGLSNETNKNTRWFCQKLERPQMDNVAKPNMKISFFIGIGIFSDENQMITNYNSLNMQSLSKN